MILIRADANEHVGAGHVMRCATVARALEERRQDVLFVTADHNADGLISGLRSVCLGTKWDDMDGELPAMERLIKETGAELVLVDSYCVSREYFSRLRSLTRTVYIDDLNASCWDVDCLVNYNVYATCLDYSPYAGTGTGVFLGLDYVPLREEFRSLPQHEIRGEISDIMISAGGSDPEMMTERLIVSLCPVFPKTRFHFIVGSLNPRIDSIRRLAPSNAILHVNERNMSGLMRECDLAISASGTTLYELCACGTPSVIYVLADNQTIAARRIGELGVMLNAGDCRGNCGIEGVIAGLIREMDAVMRAEMSARMQGLVDGECAGRIADLLMA